MTLDQCAPRASVAGASGAYFLADACFGRTAEAFELFEKVLPQIVFCLQTLELYHYCEKRLLQAMGLLSSTVCRTPAYTPDADTARFVDELNARVLLAQQGCAAIA